MTNHTTKFYTLGNWSLDNKVFARTSVHGQKDADGNVDTDTLMLNQPVAAAQIRVTLSGTNGARPALKFLGLSFSNTKVSPVTRPPNHAAWGKIIPTPEHSQHGYPDAKGWCSPTSLSMALSRWADILNRPEMNLTVPEVAAKVYDNDFAGTGNWPFNTAFAGSFSGMRSYVTRFDDLAEVEDWIAAGIPVILSARWDWLQPGRPPDSCRTSDRLHRLHEKWRHVVINDPAARLELGTVNLAGIRKVVAAVKAIPVIGNGDIISPVAAKKMFDETGCAGVSIGRGAFYDPWIFKRTDHLMRTGELLPEPSFGERVRVLLRHLDLMIEVFGETHGCRMFRKVGPWYSKRFPGRGYEFNKKVVQVATKAQFDEILASYIRWR